MAKTSAERVQAFRVRQAGLIVSLRGDLAAAVRRLAAAEIVRDEALGEVQRLTAVLASGGPARCENCKGELACPRCYRADDF